MKIENKKHMGVRQSWKTSLTLNNIIEIDALELALYNTETPGSITLADKKLFKKCPCLFNSQLDNNQPT